MDWQTIRREEHDAARLERRRARSLTTPAERRETRRANRKAARDRWQDWKEQLQHRDAQH